MLTAREILFIIVYLIEQLSLVFLSYLVPKHLTLWISIFPVILLSTMAIEKVLIQASHEKHISNMQKLLDKKEEDKKMNEEFKLFKKDYNKRKW